VHYGTDAADPAEVRCGQSEGTAMLTTVAVVLIVLWLLGILTSYTMGGFVHILLVIAIVVVLIRIIQGRNPLKG
jgi:fatty acid desaturase